MSWLKSLLGFENNFTKNLTKDIIKNPTRLLTGVDPLSTKISNAVTGQDNDAMVNMFGSPAQQYYDKAQAAGIDTDAAGQFHKTADVVAGLFGANGLTGVAGKAGAALGMGTGGAGAVGGAGGATGAGGAAGTGGGLLGSLGSNGSNLLKLGSTLAGAVASSKGGSSQSGEQTVTNKQEMDPRVAAMLFGSGTSDDPGLLMRYQGMLDTPQANGAKQYGQANDNYAWTFAAHDLEAQREGANKLLAGNTAAPMAQAAQVNAPSQNGMDLKGSYDSLINGPAGANPYLTGAIGKGINQSSNAFGAMQRDSTKNLLENIMPSIRSNSVLSGQYGGSRQGIAEGKALDSFATEQQRAMEQFGQYNTDAAVSAQAGAYDADKNRQLSATQGLGAQQYGVAQQNASMAQQTNLANQSSQLSTNAMNNQAIQAGTGLLGGILSDAGGQAQNQSNYNINQASKVNGLLSPYLGQVPGSSTTSQPLYENKTGNLIGGAMAGLGMYNQLFGK